VTSRGFPAAKGLRAVRLGPFPSPFSSTPQFLSTSTVTLSNRIMAKECPQTLRFMVMDLSQLYRFMDLPQELSTISTSRLRHHYTKMGPFRFMELPKELQLMVYGRIPRQIHYTKAKFPEAGDDKPPALILITRTCSLALLRVSMAVTSEAQVVVSRTVKEWILGHPPRVMVMAMDGDMTAI
jgi:hypothetical protein